MKKRILSAAIAVLILVLAAVPARAGWVHAHAYTSGTTEYQTTVCDPPAQETSTSSYLLFGVILVRFHGTTVDHGCHVVTHVHSEPNVQIYGSAGGALVR